MSRLISQIKSQLLAISQQLAKFCWRFQRFEKPMVGNTWSSVVELGEPPSRAKVQWNPQPEHMWARKYIGAVETLDYEIETILWMAPLKAERSSLISQTPWRSALPRKWIVNADVKCHWTDHLWRKLDSYYHVILGNMFCYKFCLCVKSFTGL